MLVHKPYPTEKHMKLPDMAESKQKVISLHFSIIFTREDREMYVENKREERNKKSFTPTTPNHMHKTSCQTPNHQEKHWSLEGFAPPYHTDLF